MDNLEYDPNRSSRTADTQFNSSQPAAPKQTFSGSAYDSSLEDSSPTVVGGGNSQYGGGIGSGFGKKSLSPLTYNRKAMAITGAALAMILLIGIGAFGLNSYYARKAANKISAESFKVGKLDTSQIKESTTKAITEAEHLDINGQLQVGNTIILTPTQAPNPSTAVAGQIYYDKTTNQPYYYNGTTFVSITQQAGVTSLGGSAGAIGVGDGLAMSGSRIVASAAVLQAAAQAGQPHVNTLQGQSGAVSLNGGPGIAVNGTSFTNTGVLSVNGGTGSVSIVGTTNQINVANSGSTLTLSLPQDIATTSSPSFDALSVVSGLNIIDQVSGNATTLVGSTSGPLSVNQTISIPETNYFGNTDEICLYHLGNCTIGGGGGVGTGGSADQNYIVKFTNSGATQIGNSLLYDNGTSVGINTATPDANYLLDVNGNVNIHGSSGLTLGVVSSSTGQLRFATSSSGFTGLLSTDPLAQATSFTLPDPGRASDEICLKAKANCTGSGSGSNFINNDTTKQTGANFNIQSRNGQVAAVIQGASNQDIIQLFASGGLTPISKVDKNGNLTAVGATFNGNVAVGGGTLTVGVPTSVLGGVTFARNDSSNVLTLISAAVGADKTITIPSPLSNQSGDTVCLKNLANCTSGSGGTSNFINNDTQQQVSANFNIQSASGEVAAKIQGATNQDILNIYTSTNSTNPLAKFDKNGYLNLGIANSAYGKLILHTAGTGSVTIDSLSQNNAVALSVPADTNATDTFCLVSLKNCGSASGNGNYINNTTTKQTNANITIASGSGVTAQLQGSSTNDILQLFSSTDTNLTSPVAKFSGSGDLTAAKGTFNDDLTVTGTKKIFANYIQQTASSNPLTINAGVDGISFIANGITFTLPTSGGLTQEICTTGVTCIAGGGTALTIDPVGVQTATGSASSIYLNKTGLTGNILQLQSHGNDAFILDNGGNANLYGDLTFANSSTIKANNILQTANGQDMTINAGNNKISFVANGITFTLPTSGTGPQTICTTGITCVAGGGAAITIDPGITPQDMPGGNSGIFANKSGATGNVIQLQAHGADAFILDNTGNATFGANATIKGASGLTLGVASGTPGKLTLRTGQAGSVTIDSVNRTTDLAVSFPVDANPTDTFCLVTLANCGSSSGNGNYIKNQSGNQTNANFNITAQTGVAAKIQGATNQDIVDFYLDGNSTDSVFSVDKNGVLALGIASSANPGKLTLRTGQAGSVTIDSVNRTTDLAVSFPVDANPTDTFCLVTLANCGSSSGNGNYIKNGTAVQSNANFNISAQTGVAVQVQGASGSVDIADFFTSTDPNNPIVKLESTGILTLGNNSTSGALKILKNGSANAASLMVIPAGLSRNISYYLPDGTSSTDTICTVNAANCTASAGSFISNSTSLQTAANFNIAATSGIAAQIKGAGSSDILDLYSSSGGTAVARFDASGLTLGHSTSTGQLKLGFNGSPNAATIQINPSGIAQATTYYVPDPTGGNTTDTFCTVNSGNCTGANGGSGNSNYIWNTTSLQPSANIAIDSTSGQVAAKIKGAAGQKIAQFISSSSSVVAEIDATGKLISTGATISGATGINAGINSDTNINTGGSTGNLTIGGTNLTSFNIYAGSSGLSILPSGASNTGVLIRPVADSTAAFQVQRAVSSTPVLNVDTTASITSVRSSADFATLGSELVTNTNYTTAAWTTTGWTPTVSDVTHITGNTSVLSTNQFAVTAGVSYQVSFTVGGGGPTVSTVTPQIGGTSGSPVPAGSSTTQIITATTTGSLQFIPSSTYTNTLSAISVKVVSYNLKPALVVQNSSGTTNLEVRTHTSVTNLSIGLNSAQSNTVGVQNTSIGSYSLQNNTTGASLVAIGYQALMANTIGQSNTAVGSAALKSLSTGFFNVAVGTGALQSSVSAFDNVAVGNLAMSSNTGGGENVGIGSNALSGNTTGGRNVAVGKTALGSVTTGTGNTALGYSALGSTSGQFNSAVGYQALQSVVAGDNNIAIGNNAGYQDSNGRFATSAGISNSGAIGAFAQVQASNSIVIGSVDVATKVGVGTTVPSNTFSVSPLDYQSGTATRTNSSATLTGTGTTWTSAMVGDQIIFADGTTNTVAGFTDATHITMGSSYGGTTDASPVYYRFHKVGFQVTSAGNVGVGTSSPSYLLQATGTSASAFAVQNASGSAALSIDTTALNSFINNPSFEYAIAGSGWTGTNTTTFAQSSAGSSYIGNYSLSVVTNTTAGAGAKYTTGSGSSALAVSTTYTLSWYARNNGTAFTDMIAAYARNGSAETNCTGINTQTVVTTGWTKFSCQIVTDNTAPAANAYVIIKQNGGGVIHTFFVDAVQLEVGTVASGFRETSLQINGRINGPLTVQNSQDSTTALQVLNSAGGSLMNIDTINSQVAFRSPVNNTTAFQIQNSSGTSLLNADTSSGNIGIGTVSPSAKLHVIGTKAATVATGTPNSAISGLTVVAGAGGDNQDYGVGSNSTAGNGGGIALTTGAGGDDTAYACPLGLCSGGYGGSGGTLALSGGNGGTVTTSAINLFGGVGGNGGTVNLAGGSGGVGYFGGSGGTINLQAGAGYAGTGSTGSNGNINLLSANTVTVKGIASSTSFQIQNTASANILTVNTASNSNLITNGDFEGAGTTGWTAKGSTTLTQSSAQQWQGNNSLSVATTAAANDGAKFNYTMTNGQSYTVSLYAKVGSGTITDVNIGRQDDGSTDTNCLTGQTLTTSWKRFTCTFTAGAQSGTPNIFIKKTGGSAETFFIDGVQLQTGSTASAFNAGGALQIGGIINSPLALQNKSDSTTAFQILNATGGSLVVADTVNSNLTINTNSKIPTTHLATISQNTTGNSYTVATTTTGNTLNVNRTNTVNIAGAGSITQNGSYRSSTNPPPANCKITSYTVNSGTNTVLVAYLSYSASATGVTYGATPMIQVPGSGGQVWYLTSPTPGTQDITFSGGSTGCGSGNNGLFASSWDGVDQTTPVATMTGSNYGACSFSCGVTTTITVATAVGDQVIDTWHSGQTGAPSLDSGRTVDASSNQAGNWVQTSHKTATTTSTSVSETAPAGSIYQNGLAFVIKKNNIDLTVTGAMTTMSSNCTITQGTCTDSSNILNLNQQYSSASGAVLAIQNSGTGADIQLGSGIIRPASDSATALRIQNANGTNTLFSIDTSSSLVKVALGSASASSAICSTLGNGSAPVAGTAYELRDCSSAPAADYAERYPVASGVGYGDIVATGTQMVNTYDETDGNVDWSKVKGQVTQLVKTGAPYQTNTIGVVSNNYGDFTSAGANIKDSDNPMPVALNGRVPVNIAASSDPIQPGDYLTTSSEAGKAMKANGAGYVIGKALASWNPGSGETQVMVYIEPGYYNGPTITSYLQNGGSGSLVNLNVSGKATIVDLEVTGSAKFAGSITVGGHIITAGNAPIVTVSGPAGAGGTIDIDGNDTSGTITITAGTGASAGDLGSITFSQPFGKTPKTILSAQDEDSQTAQIYPTGKNTSSFKLHTSQALQAGKTYTFDYFIVQ